MNQLEIQEAIQHAGFNVVTCGDCGSVLLHETSDEEIICPHCGYASEPCDFPDLYYTGWDYMGGI